MEYLIAFLFFASVWHFVYQAILLPGIHVRQRNRLFALRDRLRTYHFEHSAKANALAFEVAQNGLNNAINSVELLDLAMQMRIMHLHATSEKYRKRVAQRNEALEAAQCKEIHDIVHEANDVLKDIFYYNTGGWMIYIVPLALCAIFSEKVVSTASDIFAAESRDAQVFFDRGRRLAMAA